MDWIFRSRRAPLVAGPLPLAALAALALALAGCERGPSEAEIHAWRRGALEANKARQAARAAATKDAWHIGIAGSVRAPAPGEPGGVAGTARRSLSLSALERLGTERVVTRSPHAPPYPATPVEFGGVALRTILEAFGAGGAATITFLANDGYRVTIEAADARRHPILLATSCEGAPITRTRGGPVYLVFPHDDVPALRERYTGDSWCFYVAYVIVGDEEPDLLVAGRRLGAKDLAALPEAAFATRVGYRLGWPREPVVLRGRRLRDVCALALGRPLLPEETVVVRGKAPLDRDPKKPRRISGADALRHDIILAERAGAEGRRIRSARGGPLCLAFPVDAAPELGERYGPADWVSFVEEIEVRGP